MSKNVKGIVGGFANLVTGSNEEMKDRRLKICQACPIFSSNWCLEKRGGCGCYLPAKTSYKDEECPKGKWNKEE